MYSVNYGAPMFSVQPTAYATYFSFIPPSQRHRAARPEIGTPRDAIGIGPVFALEHVSHKDICRAASAVASELGISTALSDEDIWIDYYKDKKKVRSSQRQCSQRVAFRLRCGLGSCCHHDHR